MMTLDPRHDDVHYSPAPRDIDSPAPAGRRRGGRILDPSTLPTTCDDPPAIDELTLTLTPSAVIAY